MTQRPFSSLRHLYCILAAVAGLVLAGCGSSSGSGGDPPPPGATVVVSGKITFDRIPFRTLPDRGLDAANPVESPARHVVVEAIDGNTVLASTTTDEAGDYSLTVPAERNMFIRAKAQMLKTGAAPTWNFRVRNNTSSNALYALDGSVFNSGTANSTRSLRAATGWGTTSYTGTRAAAPFAILDTVYQAKQLILSAQANTVFPELSLFWSPQNRDSNIFCPRDGNIVSSIYITFGPPPFDRDDCAVPNPGVDGIYVLGFIGGGAGDTDEFDQHIVAHEFGHYVEDAFSRSDSLGGSHEFGQILDLRVAFSEGWGNAFAGMVLNDPLYRDSSNGVANDFGFDMKNGARVSPGWYSEHSIHRILWKIFDADTASGGLNLGFGPVFAAMTGGQRTADALASIYTFVAALGSANPASASAVGALLGPEQIFGSGAFANNETNNAGGNNHLLPIYTTFSVPGQSQAQLCGTRAFGFYNKAGNRRFLRLNVAQQSLVSINVQGPNTIDQVPADPDILVWRRGELIAEAQTIDSTQEVLQATLPTGTYVAEIYDYSHVEFDAAQRRGDTCMTISVTGN